MSKPLSHFIELLKTDPARLRGELTGPVLVTALPEPDLLDDGPTQFFRAPSQANAAPASRSVYEVKKGDSQKNAFAFGITIGRAAHNDVCVPDPSLSRFHAYLQQVKGGGWTLTDSESINGTWVGALKLRPSEPVSISNNERLRFGTVQLLFLDVEAFLRLIAERP